VNYAYDAANRLTQIAQAAGLTAAQPSTAQSVGFTYDTANRPTKATLPNGMTMDYGYDNASQLTSITYKKADTTVQGNLTYTYDAVGQRNATGGTLARTALPDAIGTTVHNANNQLTTKDAVAHTYDLNGNLTNDGSRTYTWNVHNQLATIAGADTASYYYDAFGRRRSATVNGQSTSTLYDGWNPIQLQVGGVAVENRLYGLGLDSVYNRTRGSVTESFLRDALGSTIELRNAAQVQTVQYTYDPYGGTVGSVASSNTIKYTGREQDAGDLYYYRNRYFKPSTGRFVSEDPIGLAGGSNLYAYVSGNPVNLTDPLGLSAGKETSPSRGIGGVCSDFWDWYDKKNPPITDLPLKPVFPDKDCKAIKQQCIEICSTTPPLGGSRTNQGMPFFNCLNKCLEDNGCL
jgi:RHS repeat-associated protein